jgi:hypothetical protein
VPALVAVESYNSGRLISEQGVEIENVWLTGASADLFRIRDLDVERGRAFTAPEDRAGVPVVLLGYEAAETLFGTLDPLGRTVKINGRPFEVIGVMKRQGTLFGMSMDNRAFAPARSPMGRFVNPQGIVDRVLVKPLTRRTSGRRSLDIEATCACATGCGRRRQQLRHRDGATESMSFWENIRKILMIAFPAWSPSRWSSAASSS